MGKENFGYCLNEDKIVYFTFAGELNLKDMEAVKLPLLETSNTVILSNKDSKWLRITLPAGTEVKEDSSNGRKSYQVVSSIHKVIDLAPMPILMKGEGEYEEHPEFIRQDGTTNVDEWGSVSILDKYYAEKAIVDEIKEKLTAVCASAEYYKSEGTMEQMAITHAMQKAYELSLNIVDKAIRNHRIVEDKQKIGLY